ncbi:MAG: CHAT domain-containing protein [Acidimicrobiia bacterium]|nr:CHAT domain-containing protein [Acidimicrobiia bacterium]
MASASTAAYHALDRFRRSGDLEALAQAEQEAYRSIEEQPDHLASWTALANVKIEQFHRCQDHAALPAAVEAFRRALALAGDSHRHEATTKANLGTALLYLFRRTGVAEQIHESVELLEEAVPAQVDERQRRSHQNALAMARRESFKVTGRVSDLLAAEELLEGMLAEMATGDPLAAPVLTNLAQVLLDRERLDPDPNRLRRPVELSARAWRSVPPSAPVRTRLVLNWLNLLRDSARRSDDGLDVVELEELVASTGLEDEAKDNGTAAALLFAVYLHGSRHRRDPDRARSAVHWASVARAATAPGSGAWVERTSDLALALVNQATFEGRGESPEAVDLYREAARARNRPEAALIAARGWFWWAEQTRDWAMATEAAEIGLSRVDELVAGQATRSGRAHWVEHARNLVARSGYAFARVDDPLGGALRVERSRAKLLCGGRTPPTGQDLRELSERQPLVYLTTGPDDGRALALDERGPRVVELPGASTSAASRWARRFQDALERRSRDVAAWRAEIDDVLGWVGAVLLRPLARAGIDGDRLKVVPTGALGLLPMAGAWWVDDGTGQRKWAVERWALSIVPAAAMVTPDVPVPRPERVSLRTLIATPSGSLQLEAHGRMVIDDPEASVMTDAETSLTAAEVRQLDLGRVQLAILAACETSRIGRRLPDEAIGLAAAFLEAGAARVIATQWPIPDAVETTLLLAKLESLLSDGCSPVTALASAQRWIRTRTNGQLVDEYPDVMGPVVTAVPGAARSIWASRIRAEHPYWWAGFHHVG